MIVPIGYARVSYSSENRDKSVNVKKLNITLSKGPQWSPLGTQRRNDTAKVQRREGVCSSWSGQKKLPLHGGRRHRALSCYALEVSIPNPVARGRIPPRGLQGRVLLERPLPASGVAGILFVPGLAGASPLSVSISPACLCSSEKDTGHCTSGPS